MEATSVARFTRASATPSSLSSAFSMRPTHEAQVIPPISSVQVSVAIAGTLSVAPPALSGCWPVSGEAVVVIPSSQS
jgi:hypothetical protein